MYSHGAEMEKRNKSLRSKIARRGGHVTSPWHLYGSEVIMLK